MMMFAPNRKLHNEAVELEKEYLKDYDDSPFNWTYQSEFDVVYAMMKNRNGREISCYNPRYQCDGGTLYFVEKYFERRCKKEKFLEEDFDNYFIQLLDKKQLSEEEAEKKIKELKAINKNV